MHPENLLDIKTDLPEKELVEVCRAMSAGLGTWSNHSLFCGHTAADFTYKGEIYHMTEWYELTDTIRREGRVNENS
jgi:hypothetical protein